MNENALKKEILIAKTAMKESLLYDNVSNKTLVCDIYCLCSHFDYTSFVQIYEDNEAYFLLYARTFVADYLGLESSCQTFESTREAKTHSGKVGKIICGMKTTPKLNSVIEEVLTAVPMVSEREEKSNTALDGRFTYIKYHTVDKELSFYDASKLKCNAFSKEQVIALNNLYALIRFA